MGVNLNRIWDPKHLGVKLNGGWDPKPTIWVDMSPQPIIWVKLNGIWDPKP